MKSKQGDEICFGCQKNYKLNQTPKIEEDTRKEPISNPSNIKPVEAYPSNKQPVNLFDKKILVPSNNSVTQTVESSLGIAVQFYHQKLQVAIARGDEVEVNRIMTNLKEVATINKMNNS
jgi:hypothetical protein